MKLEDIRKEIDIIDDEINELFQRRMETVLSVAKYKKENQIPVLNASREREIIQRVTDRCKEETSLYTKILFSTMFEMSRSYQNKVLSGGSSLGEKIDEALQATEKTLPHKATVACQGIEGAYSQQACDKLFQIPSIMYFKSFSGVFDAVDKGLCRYGVLPVENSIHGTVGEVYDLMQRHNFYIVKSIKLKLDNVLLARKGVQLSQIKEVYSHEQALSQCEKYLKTLGVKVTVCDNTAVAAKLVAQSQREDVAAVSSSACADIYGLSVLEEGIADSDFNYTRFILISKALEIYPGSNKISILLTAAHKPGSLYSFLSKFAAFGINLTKIESRPVAGKDFEFLFYLDMETSVYSEEFKALLSDFESSRNIVFLGGYQEN